MKSTGKTALGGILAALSVVTMFLFSFIPNLTYALPAFAGFLVMFAVIEINKSWALGIFLTTSALSALLIADKEIPALYILFFGYYPIFKSIFESHIKIRVFEYLLKFLLFNAAIIAFYFITVFLLAIPFDDMDSFGKYAIPILLTASNVTFFIYDFALTRCIGFYILKYQKRVRKMLKIK